MKKTIFMVCFLLFVTNCFGATQLLKTVKPSGGDYTSLEACMNANEQNLVTADKYFDVEIDGTWSSADTTACVIHNYTTDATRYINIYTTAAARHKGVWSTSYYILAVTSANAITKNTAGSAFVRISGLQISTDGSGHGIGGNFSTEISGDNRYTHNIIKSSNGTPTTNKFGIVAFRSTFYIFNNICYGFLGTTNAGISTYSDSPAISAYSNTCYGNTRGLYDFSGSVRPTLKNIISYNNTIDYVGTFKNTSTHNLAKDTTTPEFNTYYDSKTLTFTNTGAGTEDFHLVSIDTDAIDLGTDTSGEGAPLNFTDDIDGVTRSGTWDVGADEFVSEAPPSAIPQIITNIF